jgi:hypothetical protein
MVTERTTGLMWQQRGSSTMTFDRTEEYIEELNRARFGGFDDWRLPTLEEAMSLLDPDASDGSHLSRLFTRGNVNFIWTADRARDGRGWVVYFSDGMLSPERLEFNAWARAVRSLSSN